MITGETNNPADAGTDNTEPSDALDNLENLDFWEPGDDEAQDNPELAGDEAETDSEPDEPDSDDGQESDGEDAGDDADDADGQGEDAPDEPDDEVTVTVNGEKLPLSVLKSGYMMRQDHTRKTQEIATQRQNLEALASRVNNSVSAIAELLNASIPQPPDQSLLFSADPAKVAQFHRQKYLHEAATAKVAEVIENANAPKDALKALTDEQHKEAIASENAKLMETFPHLAKPESRKKFFETTASVAKELGYSDEEIATATDHRLFKLAHYAKIGLQAEAARKKANAKVQGVPPVAPQKRQQNGATANARRNQDAMKRLRQTGSISDALKVDFD